MRLPDFPTPVLQSPMFQSHGNAEDRISMREIRRAIQRIDVPAIVAALIVQSLLFAQNIVRGPTVA